MAESDVIDSRLVALLRFVIAAGFAGILLTHGFSAPALFAIIIYASASIPLLASSALERAPRTVASLIILDLAFFALMAFLLPLRGELMLMGLFLAVLVSALARKVSFAVLATVVCAAVYAAAQQNISWSKFPAEISLFFVVSLITSYYAERLHLRRRKHKLAPSHITPDGKVFSPDERLVRTQHILSAVATHTPHAIVVLEKKSPTYVNHAFYRMFDLKGSNNPFEIDSPDDVLGVLEKLGIMGIVEQAEETAESVGPKEVADPEQKKTLSVNAFPVTSPFEKKEIRWVILTINDVTERREMERRRCAIERREGEIRALAKVLSFLRRAAVMLKAEPDQIILPLDKLVGDVMEFTTLASVTEQNDGSVTLRIFVGGEVSRRYVDAVAEKLLAEFARIRSTPPPPKDKIRIEIVGDLSESGASQPRSLTTAPIWVGRRPIALLAMTSQDGEVGLGQRMLLDAIALHYQVVMERVAFVREHRQLRQRVQTITTRLHSQQSLIDELQRLQQLKSNIIMIVSHELRTPLTVISASLSLLEEVIPQEETAKALFERLKKSVERMSDLLDRVTEVAVLESHTLEIRKQVTTLRHRAEEAFSQLAPLAEERRIRFHIEIPPTLQVLADPKALLRIFHILMENAIKHTPEETEVFITAVKENDFVRVSVRDTGEGLAEEHVSCVFEDFSQVNRKSCGGYGGLGLGLAVAKHLVELQGGKIWLESRRGEGCNFIFTLPVPKISGGDTDGEQETGSGG